MQIHKIVLTVIDFEELDQKGVIDALENASYPNRSISPIVLVADTRDCGEWHDEHPLNNRSTANAEIERLFGS